MVASGARAVPGGGANLYLVPLRHRHCPDELRLAMLRRLREAKVPFGPKAGVAEQSEARRLLTRYTSSKYTRSAAASHRGSLVPESSRAECMLSCGTPTSTVSIPKRVAVIGPIVVPHGMLLRLTNICQGTPAASKTRCSIAEPAAVVA